MVTVIEMAANRMGTATLMGEQIDWHLKPRGVIVSKYLVVAHNHLSVVSCHLGCDWIVCEL
jgi:hypothetical protein